MILRPYSLLSFKKKSSSSFWIVLMILVWNEVIFIWWLFLHPCFSPTHQTTDQAALSWDHCIQSFPSPLSPAQLRLVSDVPRPWCRRSLSCDQLCVLLPPSSGHGCSTMSRVHSSENLIINSFVQPINTILNFLVQLKKKTVHVKGHCSTLTEQRDLVV